LPQSGFVQQAAQGSAAKAAWTSAALLVLRFHATLPQNNHHSSSPLAER